MSTLPTTASRRRRRPAGNPGGAAPPSRARREHPAVEAIAVSLEDAADIRASLGGDGEAYARLMRRYQRPIGQYLWRFARSRGECEELLQDVFVEAYYSLSGFRGRAPFVHWLKRIATRTVYRHWRRRRSAPAPQPLDETAAAMIDGRRSLPGDPEEAREAVQAMLALLGPRDRLVLTLMYLEERTPAEIAELTGWSVAMVKVQAHRARGRLRRLLNTGDRRRD